MASDSKKVQTLVNRVADEMVKVRASLDVINDYRDRYQAAAPDVRGTPLDDGTTAALDTALASLTSEVNNPVWTALIKAKVDSHRGEAL